MDASFVGLPPRDARWLALSVWLVGSVIAAYGAVAPWVECPRHVWWIVWQPPRPAVAAAYTALGLGAVTVMSTVVMAAARRRRYLPRVAAMISALLSAAGAVVAAVALRSTQASDAYGFDGVDIVAVQLTAAPWMLLAGLVEASVGAAWLWRIAAARRR
jgi:hypothetical protein